MPDREDGRMVLTDFGWALESEKPIRKDLFWVPTGTTEVHTWENDEVGWVRIRPAITHPCRELHHA